MSEKIFWQPSSDGGLFLGRNVGGRGGRRTGGYELHGVGGADREAAWAARSVGVGIYSPSPLRPAVSMSPRPSVVLAAQEPEVCEVRGALSSRGVMIGGGEVIKMQRLISVKLD